MPANSVIAKLHNQASYEEGEATEALDPGMGCVLDESTDPHTVRPANDEPTKRVVREPRNPPHGLGEAGASPLAAGYDADTHVETVGFNPHDEARARLAADGEGGTAGEGDLVGWDANGELAAGASNPIGHVQELLTDVSEDFDMAVVEFI